MDNIEEMYNKILKEQGVHIWDANGSREFLDSRGCMTSLGGGVGRSFESLAPQPERNPATLSVMSCGKVIFMIQI